MDATKLTDYQLFEIIQNEELDNEIKNVVIAEFDKRRLSIVKVQELYAKHAASIRIETTIWQEWKYLLLLILFPYAVFLNSYLANRKLISGGKKKWSSFWVFICLGYLFWLIIFILIGKFLLIKH